MQWGSISDIVTAVAAVAALVAATFAAHAAIKTNVQQGLQLERLEAADRERLAAEERKQAELVAAWLGLDRADSPVPVVRWSNSSAQPVYDVTYFMSTPFATTEALYRFAGPTEPTTRPRAQQALLSAQDELVESWEQLLAEDQFRVAVTFRDSGNRWWLRDYFGTVTKQVDEQAAREARQRSLSEFITRHGEVT